MHPKILKDTTHPVNKCALGVQQIKLVVETRPRGSDTVYQRMPCQVTHEVVLESMQSERDTLARSPPGTRAGGSLQIPS